MLDTKTDADTPAEALQAFWMNVWEEAWDTLEDDGEYSVNKRPASIHFHAAFQQRKGVDVSVRLNSGTVRADNGLEFDYELTEDSGLLSQRIKTILTQ